GPGAPASQAAGGGQADATDDVPVTFPASDPAAAVPPWPASGAGSGTPTSAPAATPAGVPGTRATTVAPPAVLPIRPAAPPTSAPAGGGHSRSGSAPFTFGFWPHDNLTFDAPVINALGAKPAIVNYYSAWRDPFKTRFAQDARADGITTFVELEPWNCGG